MVIPWCDSCREREAARHFRLARYGEEPEEAFLCIECARTKEQAQGWASDGVLLSDIIARLLSSSGDASLYCPQCGQDVEDLVRYGRAGCPACYSAFQSHVEDVLYRSVGRVRHRGKAPRRM